MKSFIIWLVTPSYFNLLVHILIPFYLYNTCICLGLLIIQVASGRPFDSKDYMAATPSWAVYGAEEGGFDPGQARYKKERHHKSSH